MFTLVAPSEEGDYTKLEASFTFYLDNEATVGCKCFAYTGAVLVLDEEIVL